MTEEKDIFDRMIGMGLEMVILDVLTLLDSQDIANVRLTCHKWRNVTNQLLWNTETGKKYLEGLLKNNFLYKEPRVTTKQIFEIRNIAKLNWDKKDIIIICVTSNTDRNQVMCFNTDTLDLRWEKKCIGIGESLIFNDYAIFIEAALPNTIHVLRRLDGQCLYKLDLIGSYGGLQLWNKRLAIAMRNNDGSYIQFYDIDYLSPKVLQMSNRGSGNYFLQMDNDENHLISCSSTNSELVLWDFQTGEAVKTLTIDQPPISPPGAIKIKWPYIVVSLNTEKCMIYKIYNFELGTLIHDLPSSFSFGGLVFQLTNMWLMGANKTVELFYWPDLIQEAVGLDHVAKRSFNTEFQINDIGGRLGKTMMITTKENNIVVRKFWP
jgi:WD40 repeat protein